MSGSKSIHNQQVSVVQLCSQRKAPKNDSIQFNMTLLQQIEPEMEKFTGVLWETNQKSSKFGR
jgi:hypothetical protein